MVMLIVIVVGGGRCRVSGPRGVGGCQRGLIGRSTIVLLEVEGCVCGVCMVKYIEVSTSQKVEVLWKYF